MINAEGRTGLCTGFASYIAAETGQTIILKAGMLPAKTPVRVVEMKKGGIK